MTTNILAGSMSKRVKELKAAGETLGSDYAMGLAKSVAPVVSLSAMWARAVVRDRIAWIIVVVAPIMVLIMGSYEILVSHAHFRYTGYALVSGLVVSGVALGLRLGELFNSTGARTLMTRLPGRSYMVPSSLLLTALGVGALQAVVCSLVVRAPGSEIQAEQEPVRFAVIVVVSYALLVMTGFTMLRYLGVRLACVVATIGVAALLTVSSWSLDVLGFHGSSAVNSVTYSVPGYTMTN